MKRFAILFLIILAACATSPLQRDIATYIGGPAKFPVDQKLTYPVLVNLLRTNHVATVADMLKLLKPRYPDFLNQRTAMYTSDSLQEASFKEPRVIVYGPDAKFVFTFNGGNHQAGGASVEAFQFNDEKKEFDFHEIVFKKEMKTRPQLGANEIQFETDNIIVSTANPVKCMDCHGYVHMGPIWDNSFNWRGAYGSNDDILYGSFGKRYYKLHGGYEYLADLKYPRSQGRWIDLPDGSTDRELNGYLEYLANAPTHPRYQNLPPQVFEAGFRKFAARMPIENIDESAAIEVEGERLGIAEPHRPNFLLTDQLLELSMESLIADIEKKPSLRRLLIKTLSSRLMDPDAYPFFFGAGRLALVGNWSAKLSQKIEPSFLAQISRKSGTFQDHFKAIIAAEFEMQNEKIQQLETDFHSPLIVSPKWPGFGSVEAAKTVDAYADFLGHSLSRTEVIAIDSESGPLPDFALLSYILRYGGIDLSLYDINRKRVISFHDSDLRKLFDYLASAPD